LNHFDAPVVEASDEPIVTKKTTVITVTFIGKLILNDPVTEYPLISVVGLTVEIQSIFQGF
jgi:hypothetical protein